jgi:hypothetical protein
LTAHHATYALPALAVHLACAFGPAPQASAVILPAPRYDLEPAPAPVESVTVYAGGFIVWGTLKMSNGGMVPIARARVDGGTVFVDLYADWPDGGGVNMMVTSVPCAIQVQVRPPGSYHVVVSHGTVGLTSTRERPLLRRVWATRIQVPARREQPGR